MRYDDTKSQEFVNSKQWDESESRFLLFERNKSEPDSKGFVINSFSGNERNRLFFQSEGNFEEASTVSGADFREDGRGFVLFDFDRDGWLDMGVNSAQRPRFRILRNSMGDQAAAPNRSASVNLIGGHRGTDSQTEWSPRDPYGAQLLVTIGDTSRVYQLSCGEGLSSQNSKWIHIGMGQSQKIDRIDVTWPSGKQTTHREIAAGERVTFFENGDDSLAGQSGISASQRKN